MALLKKLILQRHLVTSQAVSFASSVERAGEFLPWHWDDRNWDTVAAPHAAPTCNAVVMSSPRSSPWQEADGKRVAGTCRVYLVGGDGINVQFAGSRVRMPRRPPLASPPPTSAAHPIPSARPRIPSPR